MLVKRFHVFVVPGVCRCCQNREEWVYEMVD